MFREEQSTFTPTFLAAAMISSIVLRLSCDKTEWTCIAAR